MDQFLQPLGLPSLGSYRINYSEDNSTYLVGPSIAYSFSEKFSIGTTLYYMQDSSKVISTQYSEGIDGSIVQSNVFDKRRSVGIVPILGIQYIPKDKLSIGLSLKMIRNFGGTRQITELKNTSSTADISSITQNSKRMGAKIEGGEIIINPPETNKIPETIEVRTGFAYFYSPKFLFSSDLIYTSGYTKIENRDRYELSNPSIFLYDNNNQELSRESTMNFAFGLEYYLKEKFAIRFGYFTNFANSKEIKWLASAIQSYLAANQRNYGIISYDNPYVYYIPSSLNPPLRFEYVNNQGFSFGMSWVTSSSSITLTYVIEKGKGSSHINSELPSQPLIYNSSSLYLIATSRR
ncbi:MAG: transporter, Ompp1/FadL/TodX family protein [Leptospiraceae bacterium]|nr:transporter, Ompp1/FadL/TodX family protein [Leptospiraceae bacterium]